MISLMILAIKDLPVRVWGKAGVETDMCKAAVVTSVMYAVEEAGTECPGVIELGHQTHCQGSRLYAESTGTLYILKDEKELRRWIKWRGTF